MRLRALAARGFAFFKSASQKQCRHLFGLAPWSRTGYPCEKMIQNWGSRGQPPWAASPSGGERGSPSQIPLSAFKNMISKELKILLCRNRHERLFAQGSIKLPQKGAFPTSGPLFGTSGRITRLSKTGKQNKDVPFLFSSRSLNPPHIAPHRGVGIHPSRGWGFNPHHGSGIHHFSWEIPVTPGRSAARRKSPVISYAASRSGTG